MLRPRYHFQPLKNWMNDPNGPVWIQDRLHMFYQYNPKGPEWGNMSWGHATTQDLLHWQHLPVALEPTPGSCDQDGVFSGCCVEHEGVPYILYTGVMPEVQCLAVGEPDGSAFRKSPHNPILIRPEGASLTGYRDPFVVRERGGYTLLIGSGYEKQGGTVLTYRNDEPGHWHYAGELCRGKFEESGDMWECPNLIKGTDNRAMLLVSAIPQGKVLAMDGLYQDGRLQPGKPRVYDLGNCFYAPNTVVLPDGRNVQWGWARETIALQQRPENERTWQGMLTLPRVVTCDGTGTFCVRPASELKDLRKTCLLERKAFTIHSGENALKGIRGRQLEIDMEFEPGASRCVLELLRAEKGKQRVTLTYDGSEDSLFADLSRAGIGASEEPVGGFVQGQPRTHMRVFIDGSIIEIYLNDRETMTLRAYPTFEDSDGLRLFGDGGVRIHKISVFELGL